MRRFIKMSFCCAALGLLLAGCSGGSDGAPGAAGAAGADGQDVDPAVVADLQAQITELQDQVKLESCATCHRDAGDEHQAVYDQYTDASAFTLVIDEASVVSVPNGDNFDVTMEFTITKNGAPYVDAGLAERGSEWRRWGGLCGLNLNFYFFGDLFCHNNLFYVLLFFFYLHET